MAFCLGFVIHEQSSTRPIFATPNPAWEAFSGIFSTKVAPTASIVKNEPIFAVGPALANILTLVLAVILAADRPKARRIVYVIAISGALYAVYAIGAYALDPHFVLWREKEAHLENLTGTFMNRNTAAAYFGSCCVIWLLLLAAQVRSKNTHSRMRPGQTLRGSSQDQLKPFAFPAAAFVSCFVALFLTGSRAGVILSVAAMTFALLLFLWRHVAITKRFMAILIVCGSALVVAQVFGGRVASRIQTIGIDDEGRVEVWKATLQMIWDHPWFGTGLGTFVSAFPLYRPSDLSIAGIWDLAHSTPLELIAELGLPVGVLIAVVWIAAGAFMTRGAISRQRDSEIVIAPLAIGLSATIHSFFDFTLQIPGYSIPFFALIGVGIAQSFPGGGRQTPSVS